jgi:hypothetical protein
MELDMKWNMQYEKLVEFQRKNGDCMVPHNYDQDKFLGSWVGRQRFFHKSNKLRQDRKERLDILEFEWRVDPAVSQADGIVACAFSRDKKWYQQYEKLVQLKRKNGNCTLPSGYYQQDHALFNWVMTQRSYHKSHKIRVDRKHLLNEIGFVWSRLDACGCSLDVVTDYNDKQWHQQYEKLVEFKRKNGHCIVPKRPKEGLSFGQWVARQRMVYNKKKMKNQIRQDRKDLLH